MTKGRAVISIKGVKSDGQKETASRVLWYPTQARTGLTRFLHAVLESPRGTFTKERRMEGINDTSLHRKSGQWVPSIRCHEGS